MTNGHNTTSTSTWMIVEDDQVIRDVLVTMCEIWGVDVITFRDGHQAMQFLSNTAIPEPEPDIALLDIRMPGPWGHKVGAAIRRHPQLSSIGMILMTAYELDTKDEAQYLAESGADRIIYKPLPAMDDLYNLIEDVLADRKDAG